MSDNERMSQASGMGIFQLGGALIGGTVGAFLGNPMLGLRIGKSLGTFAGTAYYGIKNNQKNRDAAKMERHTVQTSTYGQPIPLLYGTVRTAGNVIWSTDIEFRASRTGETDFEYRASFAVGFGEGEASKFLRLWANGTKIFSGHASDLSSLAINGKYEGLIQFYFGSPTQPIDPTIEAIEGVGNVPRFKNLIYAVFRDFPLADFGDQLPTIEAEIAMLGSQVFEKQTYSGATIDTGMEDSFLVLPGHEHAQLFTTSGSVLYVNRLDPSLAAPQVDLEPLITAHSGTATFNGRPCIDLRNANGDIFYFCVKDGTSSFIGSVFLGSAGSSTPVVSFGAPNASTEEYEIFANKDYVFTASLVGSKIRCYNYFTLALLWTRNGPDAAAVPGNFTVDDSGNIWLISWLAADPDSGVSSKFFLTKLNSAGDVYHYTITGSGKCKNIAYNTDAQSIGGKSLYAGGGASNVLLRLSVPVSASPAVTDSLANVSGPTSHPGFVSQARFSGGYFYTCDGTTIYEVDVRGAMSVNFSAALAGYGISGTLGGWGYDATTKSLWVAKPATTNFYKLFLDRYAETAPTLGSILNDLCQRAGFSATEVDTSDAYLTSTTLSGMLLNERITAKAAIERLLLAYSVGKRDAFESGDSTIKVQFLARGSSPVLSLAQADLGAGDNGSEDIPWLFQRDAEQDLPVAVTVRYLDRFNGYREMEQTVRFDSSMIPSTAEMDVSLPVVMSSGQAKQLAEILLMSLYTEANGIRLSLAPAKALLEAEDVITVTYGSNSYRLRVVSKSIDPACRSEVVCVYESASTYASLAVAETPLGPGTDTVAAVGESTVFLLDLPCLRASDDVPGLYAVGSAKNGAADWAGCVLWKSTDGIDYGPTVALTNAASWGQTLQALATAPTTTTWDDTTSLLVLLVSGTLTSATDAEIYADRRKNLIAIGSPSTGWELVQVGTVTATSTANGKPVYTLSHMLRGRFGTEWRASSHADGELIIHLDFENDVVRSLNTDIAELNELRYYKAVTVGRTLNQTNADTFTNTMVRLLPYSVTHVVATRHTPAANDWTVAFSRRSRKGQDIIDGSDIALDEPSERYEIDVLSGLGGSVLRTISVGPGLPTTTGVNLAISSSAATRAAGSFITDGYRVGQWVDLAGFSNADNNNRYQVTAVAALTLTLGNGPRTLINEASAAGRTLTAATPAFLHTEAEQLADGGVKGSFYCNIYQLSGRDEIGRGYVSSQLIS